MVHWSPSYIGKSLTRIDTHLLWYQEPDHICREGVLRHTKGMAVYMNNLIIRPAAPPKKHSSCAWLLQHHSRSNAETNWPQTSPGKTEKLLTDAVWLQCYYRAQKGELLVMETQEACLHSTLKAHCPTNSSMLQDGLLLFSSGVTSA